MREMVFDRNEFSVRPVDAEYTAEFEDARSITPIATVAVQQCIERAIGRVPMPFRVVPPRR